MENVLKMIQKGILPLADKSSERENRKEALEEQEKKDTILREMKELLCQLASNERWFQLECNEDLIDACIYQRESLIARYRYLLAQAKRMGIQNAPFHSAS